MKGKLIFTTLFALVLGLGWSSAWATDLKITPLGQKTGEFCRADRALLFEYPADDPNAIQILYDPGRTVAGATDNRLPGDLDLVLLTSVHSDHIGVGKLDQDPDDPAAVCDDNPPLAATPNSNTAEIIAGFPNSKSFLGGEMRDYMRKKVAAEAGATSQVDVLRHGGKRIFTKNGHEVQIAVITAHHSNGVPRNILDAGLAASLAPDGLTAYVGPENGYVLTFGASGHEDGLAVYLSGDTGHTSDMKHIVRDFYKARVAVVNMGDIFSMGPEEAAFAVDELIEPKTAIPSHSNQESTVEGEVKAGTRVETFINEVETKVILPLSGVPIICNHKGDCTQ